MVDFYGFHVGKHSSSMDFKYELTGVDPIGFFNAELALWS